MSKGQKHWFKKSFRGAILCSVIASSYTHASDIAPITVQLEERRTSSGMECLYTVANHTWLPIQQVDIANFATKPANWKLKNPRTGEMGSDMAPPGWSETLSGGSEKGSHARSFGWATGTNAIQAGKSQVFKVVLDNESQASCGTKEWKAMGPQFKFLNGPIAVKKNL